MTNGSTITCHFNPELCAKTRPILYLLISVHKVKREEKQHAPLGALSAELSAGKPNPKKALNLPFLYCLWCVEGWNIWIRSWKLRLDCIIQISLPWTSPLYKVSALLILDTQFTVNLWAIFFFLDVRVSFLIQVCQPHWGWLLWKEQFSGSFISFSYSYFIRHFSCYEIN